MNISRDGLSAKGNARRKLVRGTFAVPALLAVNKGSAQATTSLGMCLAKQNRLPRTEPVTPAEDGIFRYQLLAFVRVANGNPGNPLGSVYTQVGYWISGAELVDFVRANQTPFVGSNSWQRFDPATNALVGSATLSRPSVPSGQANEYALQKVNHFVSLRVSDTGAIVGAGNSGAGSAVGDSCWNSFAMGPN